jgi:hypothetical protein
VLPKRRGRRVASLQPRSQEDLELKKMLLFVVGLVTVGAGGAPSIKDAGAHNRCHRLNGNGGIQSSVVTEGCTSPVGLCTAGVFQGDHLLRGTTSFVADAVVPAAGMPGIEAPTTLSYSGLLTITTRAGSLTTRDTGIFDTAAGLFSSRDIIVAGTGIFEGATGHIFYTGTGTTTFDADASGEICLLR